MLWYRIEIFETSVINARTCWHDLETHENYINGTSLRFLDAVRGLTVLYSTCKWKVTVFLNSLVFIGFPLILL